MPLKPRPTFLLVAPAHPPLAAGLEEGASAEAKRLGCRLVIEVLRAPDPGEVWNHSPDSSLRRHEEGEFDGSAKAGSST